MRVNFTELGCIRSEHRGRSIVFASGGFDLTHAGHVLFFEDCKRFGDILVVGVASDAIRAKERGPGRPVLNEHLRLKMVDSLKSVDYAFLLNMLPEQDAHPLSPLKPVFENLRPNVWVVNSDCKEIAYREELIKKYHFMLAVLERTCPPEFEQVSTTSIIEKILRIGK